MSVLPWWWKIFGTNPFEDHYLLSIPDVETVQGMFEELSDRPLFRQAVTKVEVGQRLEPLLALVVAEVSILNERRPDSPRDREPLIALFLGGVLLGWMLHELYDELTQGRPVTPNAEHSDQLTFGSLSNFSSSLRSKALVNAAMADAQETGRLQPLVAIVSAEVSMKSADLDGGAGDDPDPIPPVWPIVWGCLFAGYVLNDIINALGHDGPELASVGRPR